ncbi:MAG: VWA domain-containing protein [Acidobacteriota bacterium]|nr:VWA domain-containing protein [Acidobacteriota bacterium]
MKRFSLMFLPAILCLTLFSVLHRANLTNAQTPATGARTRVSAAVSPTPPLTAPKTSATPPKINEEDEVLKVDTELVNLNVRVIDRNNRPINGLLQGEFKILEDNIPQQIEFFSKSEVPTNYALVIDNSGSLRSQLEKVVEAAKILVNTNKPDDETSIIRFVSRDKISIEQQFTANKTDLNDSLENLFIEGGRTAIIDAVYLAAKQVAEYEQEKGKDDRKRRALVIVSDGEDRDSYYNEAQLFELLRETDVQIYTIGFIGDLSKDGGFIGKSPQGKAKAFLERMATETGGKAYFPAGTNELSGLAKEIGSELRVQYSIGYIPSNDKNDGTFRNIKVVVDDGPNKQKRIAITRAGRTAENDGATVQSLAPAKKVQ